MGYKQDEEREVEDALRRLVEEIASGDGFEKVVIDQIDQPEVEVASIDVFSPAQSAFIELLFDRDDVLAERTEQIKDYINEYVRAQDDRALEALAAEFSLAGDVDQLLDLVTEQSGLILELTEVAQTRGEQLTQALVFIDRMLDLHEDLEQRVRSIEVNGCIGAL